MVILRKTLRLNGVFLFEAILWILIFAKLPFLEGVEALPVNFL
jgi:hypothetical protein